MNDVCSIELLSLAVAHVLSADEEAALHAHLEHCEACCVRMEQLAGGAAWQQEAAELLSTDELDAAVPDAAVWSEVDFRVEHLDSSDDANVLGQLGGYDVLAIVGRGGMGVVLKAFDRELKRCVAIKVLAPHLAHSSVARKRFAREAQAAAAVVNPHVIAIHHVQPTGRLPFLIMPLLTGESLAQRLKARGPLELTEVLRIGMQAAAGLAAAHDQGLVHRDVKPANVFVEKGVERVVITDFGLARAADDVSMTRLGVVAGTPEYMSPEQARGEALDGCSDLFSLGCVLYEMATGVSPFRTDSTMATLRRIVDEQPAAMASLVPELPPWFGHIVERLLSKDPAQRFASAGEVSQLLEQCLSHLQQPTSVPLPASLLPHATGRRSIFNVTRKGVLAMLGTIGMTLLGIVLLQATEAPDISGQWTSDEWGTVVLKAKEPGQYEGSFTGPDRQMPAASNVGAGGGILSGTMGGDSGKMEGEIGVVQGVSSLMPDGTGRVLDANKGQSRGLRLKWSRVERRFNGVWGLGDDRSGKISLRLVDNEIRGGWTTDKNSQLESGTPRLGDLLCRRSHITAKSPTASAIPDYVSAEEDAFQQLQLAEANLRIAYSNAIDEAKSDVKLKSFSAFGGGPEVSRQKELLQSMFQKNASRHVQAEALIVRLELILKTLNIHARLPIFTEQVSQSPEHSRAALHSQLHKLENVDPVQLRAEAKNIINQLRDHQHVVVGVYGTAAEAAQHLSHAINDVIVGQPAPEITADTLGKPFRLSKLRGTTVVLVFAKNDGEDNDTMFAPLRRLADDYKGKHVELVTILANSEGQILSAAALKRHIPGTVIPQPCNGPILLDWGTRGLASVQIVDSSGILHPQQYMPVYDDKIGYDTTDVTAYLDKLLSDEEKTQLDVSR